MKRTSCNNHFRSLQDVTVYDILGRSMEFCSLYKKYTSRWQDGRDCFRCGYMHRLVRLPNVRPTGGSTPLMGDEYIKEIQESVLSDHKHFRNLGILVKGEKDE